MSAYGNLKAVKNKQNYRPMCESHYEYLTRESITNLRHVQNYVKGYMMSNHHGKMNKRKSTLQKIIKDAPPIPTETTVVRAQLVNILPKVGHVFAWNRPMSFTMYHPFAVEWMLERHGRALYPPAHRTILIVKLPKGYNNAMCVGAVTPLQKNMTNAFKKFEDKFKQGWGGYNKQLQTQSEIIMGAGVKMRVVSMKSFTSKNINNTKNYGLGWYHKIQTKQLQPSNKVHVITCELERDPAHIVQLVESNVRNNVPVVVPKPVVTNSASFDPRRCARKTKMVPDAYTVNNVRRYATAKGIPDTKKKGKLELCDQLKAGGVKEVVKENKNKMVFDKLRCGKKTVDNPKPYTMKNLKGMVTKMSLRGVSRMRKAELCDVLSKTIV